MKKSHELGYFGNIWVRQNILEKTGDESQGHYHLFDHVSLLAKGSVQVEIKGHPPKIFHAPTFIVIKKEFSHKFVAISDDVLWYCVFAIRNLDGDVTDIIPDTNSPFFIDNVSENYWDQRKKLENLSVNVEQKPYNSWNFDEVQQIWKAPVNYPIDGNLYEWNESKGNWDRINT